MYSIPFLIFAFVRVTRTSKAMQTTAIGTVVNSLPENKVILLTLLIPKRYIPYTDLRRVFFCSTSAQGDITLISEAPLSSVIPSKRATADVYQLRANRAGRRIERGHLPPRPLVYRRVHSPQRCTPRLPSSPRSRRNEGCTQMRSDGLSGGKTSADRRQTRPMPATMRQLSGVINGAPTYAAANYTAY